MSKMAAEYNAINLSQGFPDFDSDPFLIKLVEDAMRAGYNQYAPMPGDQKLREQIAHKIHLLHGKQYDPNSEITITAGATQAIFVALSAIVRAGDEVIIFTPAYDCYEPTVKLFGGNTRAIQLRPPAYRPDWEEVSRAISPRTRLIIINSPHNPSGAVFSKEDMEELQRLAVRHDLFVLSDEVYEHIIFNGIQHQSASRFPDLAARSFITASFGKTFHNTGWKTGYCVAPEKMMSEFRKIHQYNVFCVNHPVQKALAIYLEDADKYLNLSDLYQQKRDAFLSLISNSRFRANPSEGTYFQLLDYSEISDEPDTEFANRLTKEHGLATIPTSVFNKDREDFKQIRVCFAKTQQTLESAAAVLNAI